MRKYNSARVWQLFTDTFDYLTLSVVIDNAVFCIHGGLSPSVSSIDQIKVLDRFKGACCLFEYCWAAVDTESRDSARGAARGSDVVRPGGIAQ